MPDGLDDKFTEIVVADYAQQIRNMAEALIEVDLGMARAMEEQSVEQAERFGNYLMDLVSRLTVSTFPSILQTMAHLINTERARLLALEDAFGKAFGELIEVQARMIHGNAPEAWVRDLSGATQKLKAGMDEVEQCRGHDH